MAKIKANSIDDVVSFLRNNITELIHVTKTEVANGFKRVGDGSINWWEKQPVGTKIAVVIGEIVVACVIAAAAIACAVAIIGLAMSIIIDVPILVALLMF